MSTPVNDGLLYERVAERVIGLIEGGTLRPGARVPSVRGFSTQQGVSISTVLQAYRMLENAGWIEARPQSGYYVRKRETNLPPEPETSQPEMDVAPVRICEYMMEIMHATRKPGIIQLGAAVPHPDLLPQKALQRALAAAIKKHGDESVSYDVPPGNLHLRTQIARRALEAGCALKPDDIVLTCGCQEALQLCLRAVASPGDTILLESPAYYGVLQIIESLGMCALELPTHPRHGVSLEALELAIEQMPVKACVLSPSFSNPLGSCMSDESKKRVVKLLSEREIPLIEDDIWGDIGFASPRPKAAKAWDKEGNVLLCSSFSKSLAPGYRVGWVAPGKWRQDVGYLKTVSTLANATLPSLAVAEFLETGGYDAHLRRLRKTFAHQVQWTIEAIDRFFPEGTRVTRPAGGQVVWVELPEHVDSLQLFHAAIKRGISISPGPIFSAKRRYQNFIRLNCGYQASAQVEEALRMLGKLVTK